MSENHTIKPDGLGDYLDTETGVNDNDGSCTGRGIINFDLYDGTNDLQEWTMNNFSNQDATNHPECVASIAERHDGKTSSAGAWVDLDGVGGMYGITLYGPEADYSKIVGVRIHQTSANAIGIKMQGIFVVMDMYSPEYVEIDSNLLIFDEYAVEAIGFGVNTTVDNEGNACRNNIIYDTGGTVQVGINAGTYSVAPPCIAEAAVENNTIDGCVTGISVTSSSCVWDPLTLTNNICTNNTTDYSGAYGWATVDAYNNCSEDATADTWKWIPTAKQVISSSTTQAHSLGNFSGTYHDKLGMSFQVDSTNAIKRIVPFLAKVLTPGTITWRIETDSSGDPSGTLADANLTGTITEADVGGGGWIIELVGTPTGLSLSTTYWFVLWLPSDPGSGEYYMWNGSSTDVYALGKFKYHPDGGVWTDFAAIEPVDAAFRIEYEEDRDNIENQTPSDLFVSEGSDVNLKAGSNAVDAGKTIAAFDWDAVHVDADNWRPQGSAWDMGALEKESAAPSDLVERSKRGVMRGVMRGAA